MAPAVTVPNVTTTPAPLPHAQAMLNAGFNLATGIPTMGIAPAVNTISGLLGGPTFGSLMNHPGVNNQAPGSNTSNPGNNNIAAQQAYQNQLPGSVPTSDSSQASTAPASQTPTPLYNNERTTAGPGPNGTGGYRIPTIYPNVNLNDRTQPYFYNPLNDPVVEQALSYGRVA